MTCLTPSSSVSSLGARIASGLATSTIVAQTSPGQGTAADHARAASAADRNEGRSPSEAPTLSPDGHGSMTAESWDAICEKWGRQ